MKAQNAGVQVSAITKRFGLVVAVDQLDLDVKEGEMLAIVGPSGCGKTTLLRIIAGLERPDAGRVMIQGTDATPLPPEKRGVGFVFQQFALFPNMNVAENIMYGLKRKGVARAKRVEKVNELLAMVGLEGLSERRPSELSAGQQQRVALARALAPDPKTLLLDEPLSALDAAIRDRLREDLRRLQRRLGITTLMVTHDQEEALALADRVAVMDAGRIEQVDTPWTLYRSPKTRFVAGFIGRGQFIHGVVKDDHVQINGMGRVPLKRLPEEAVLTHHDARVKAIVRPESVLIHEKRGGELRSNEPTRNSPDIGETLVCQAVIDDVSFGGERSLVRLRVSAGTDMPGESDSSQAPVKLSSSVDSEKAHHLATMVGARVSVSIDIASLRWFPATD